MMLYKCAYIDAHGKSITRYFDDKEARLEFMKALDTRIERGTCGGYKFSEFDPEERADKVAEKYGIWYYKVTGCKMIYYSYFGKIDGIYKIIINLDTGKQTRKRLAYEKTPKHLKGRVNYYVG